ncbi:MAG: hypothetical protein HRU20_24200 [Pseudomonadales bacterium]|nr:hypothetical protein [Pseudomonadales bacterium]
MKAQSIQSALIKLLKPLAKLLLRSGISYQTTSEWLRQAFVEAAIDDFEQEKQSITTSRVATITGLHRKEVKRLRELISGEISPEKTQLNRVQRVINAWLNLPSYCDEQGLALPIKFEGDNPSFTDLVKQSSGDITARTVFEELERMAAITTDNNGLIHLMVNGLIAPPGSNEQWQLAGQSAYDLLSTLNHNISNTDQAALMQRYVCYHLPEEDYLEFKQLSSERSQELLLELNRWLKNKTQNKDRTAHKKTVRTGLGIYHIKE